MKRILAGSIFLFLMVANSFAASDNPEIQIVDGKLTVQAVSVTLSQFLRSLDTATGMTSKVNSPELANQKMSVRFSGLDLDAAIHKSFQGLPLNYFYIRGKGITVVDRAQTVAPPTGGIASTPAPSYVNEMRTDNIPAPVPPPLPIPQSTPVPTNTGGNATNLPGGTPGGPTPQTGTAPAPTGNTPLPTFQPIGGALGAPLPTTK